ncbi:Ff.00g019180.m01.CDS01 [Fusarium sp. VM40]|nr:Ff.00g019180.m01.CDS01 [Fusarium sp. VM40]
MPAVRPVGRPYSSQNGAPAASSFKPPTAVRGEYEPLSLNDALYNHLVLPPQLPHRQDSNLIEIENAVTDRLLASVKHLRDLPNNDLSYIWASVERGLLATKSVHSGGHVDRTSLVRELNDIFGESDFLVVYVRSQNCALYIRRSQDPVLGASVVFEAFETSARNEDVLATDNALQWDFPGCAVAVPLQTYRDDGFISTLANFLDNASRESLTDFSAHALKAGTSMPEYRNTSEPALVSSMLIAILQQNGRRLAPTLLQKMVRDDVCWKNAEKPWKRLPYWLVLRVAISRYLSQRLGGEIGRVEYKFLLGHLFSEFLTHVQHSGIRIDRLDFLKKKICRRLVKLDVDNDRSQNCQVTDRIGYLFLGLGPGIQNSVSKAALFIEASWKRQKLAMTKLIPPLPKQAAFEDMKLDLKISGQTLHKIWQGYSRPVKFNLGQQNSVSVAEAAKQHLMSFALEHFKLIKKEMTQNAFCDEASYSPRSVIEKASCLVNNYLAQASGAYQNIPELKSTLILNVMDLWVSMDKAICSLYPILGEFHPIFRPEMLDVLLLSTVNEMKRLQKIQFYLQDRIAACEGPVSIFDDPVRGSFGHRVYDSSEMSDEMKDLHESIERWATNLRNAKEQEWKTKSQEYTRLSKSIDESTCVYQVDDNNPLAPGYHDPDCRRCYLKRQLARIRIQAYEHPLPSDPFVAKSVIFELVCPQTLATYRDVTWSIIACLALQGEEGIDPKCWLFFGICYEALTSPFSQIAKDTTFFKNSYGPSSYETMATASRCPQGINVHEFLAFQTIASGKSRRWLSILTELASANLNFSNEATMLLLSHLALQCGPLDSSGSVFRLIHEAFRDHSFCGKLLQQLSHRLDSLFANWRETYLMETVITLTLRLLDFSWASGFQDISEEAMSLLLRVRNACVRWFKLLRTESYKVNDAEAAQRFQQYSLWAALLCKRTFTPLTYGPLELDDCALETYIQSSIMLNDNLVVKLEALPQLLQHAIIRDIRLSYKLAHLISESVLRNPEAFRLSLREMWPEEEGCPRTFYQIQLEPDALHWISCRSKAAEDANEQTVFYNCVQGVLLVDGRPIGKLPEDPKQSLVLNELFGNQSLLTYPSARPAMQYVLCSDLPGPLLDDCFHWLNLRNGEVLIARRDRPWPDDNFRWYTLSLKDSTCARPRVYKGFPTKDYVINTYSPLFNRVTRILDSFEDRDKIVVYQPGGNRNLTVELKRLNILFYTNKNRLLESPQLQCQIDINQDAGTWYGLRSKLVCTSLTNPMHRFILVPLGTPSAQSEGCHVVIRIRPDGKYGRFSINTTLGRIDCAPEPTLVFMKALLHASTSFLLPDPLTGRTGTEEAIQWLQAGISQPWSPLTPPSIQVLQKIAQLTPRRVYYPTDLKVMRTDYWIESLPVRLQSSEFRPIVDQILQESTTLATFATKDQIAVEQPQLPSPGESHLHARVMFRQNAVERHLVDRLCAARRIPQKYIPRDRPSVTNIMHRNVLEVAQLIRKWPQGFKTTDCLAQLLSQGSTVGGFLVPFEATSLNEKLKVNVLQCWGSLIRFARETTDRYKLMYLFGPMSFNLDANMPLLRTLIASAVFGEMKELDLPQWDEFDHFQSNQAPQLDYLIQLLKPHRVAPPEDDAMGLGQYSSGKLLRKLQIERAKHESKVEEDCKFLANHLLSQWPCLEPNVSGLSRSLLVDIGPALEVIRPEWKRLFMNRDLAEHLNNFQAILDRRTLEDRYEPPPVPTSEEVFAVRIRGGEIIDLRQLLAKPYSTLKTTVAKQQTPVNSSTDRPFLSTSDFPQGFANFTNSHWTGVSKRDSALLPTSRDVTESVMKLDSIAQRLGKSKSAVRERYAKDFQKSLAAFQRLDSSQNLKSPMKMRDSEVKLSSEVVKNGFMAICSALDTPNSTVCSRQRILWLKAGDLWPIVTKATLLSSLGSVASTTQGSGFGSGMRKAILGMGVDITKYQREVRLHDLALKKAPGRYHEEESNKGHSNWSPEEYPDWLLLEIESNMMIRPVQIDVALATISPLSGSNSVLQMNMGQGKTSCIIPMAAAALANKKQLVRVIVPKALLQQTAQLLQARLGGILGRGIRHVPFSRRTPTTEKNIRAYHSIHRQMLKSAGIMICQPEHHMSFMLSGRQRLLDEQPAQAGPMIKVQEWLTRVSRDILDESDYTLAVRTQLIYPSGSQTTVDGHPHRWLVAEAVLRLVDSHLYDLSHVFPHSISVIRRKGGGFPFVFFLRQDVEDELVSRLTADICHGAGGILPMTEQAMATKDRVAVKDFISSARPRSSSISHIRTFSPDKPSLRQTIYLLRGLLVNRILMMTLKKRWNVEYGLHPQRDPIAVPFHAKGVPSDQSEWGHPDVAILFTCLAFYYDGVNPSQLRQSLEHILKSDDPSTEYDNWTKSTENFPSSLKAWNSINVDDEMQLGEIWKVVRYNEVVVDYFLNNFVFPRHAKQFEVKLQSNGWDIPLSPLSTAPDDQSSSGKPLSTGFSGTNDNRTMLPLNIEQHDLPSLHHTSAEVLTYLLHPRNRRCILPQDVQISSYLGRSSEMDLLKCLKNKSIHVLIDAGAQILEMDNITLVEHWLRVDTQAVAGLYFDQENKPWILTREGRRTPLLASPFADDLTKCLIYLDEAHTRGTDLRLPPDAKGALTLRLGQTKDHTVQAAMRLRQLGTTQVISFFIPPEVHQSIADLQNKTMHEFIDSSDVIQWLLDNTCDQIEQLQPLYYSQGIDFCRRMQAALDYPKFLTDRSQRKSYVQAIKQDEQQSLQNLYEPKTRSRAAGMQTFSNEILKGFIQDLNARKKTFQDTGKAVHASALQEVEQEREVAFEVESVRQVKKPQHYAAYSFPGLNPSLEAFIRTGRLPADTNYFIHIFHALARTGTGRKFKVNTKATNSKLLETVEFGRTIKPKGDLSTDNFLRPVNWILWSPVAEIAIVIMPEEAEALIPIMRDPSSNVPTHLLIYSAPITRKMLLFNDLTFHSIPPLPPDWKAPCWLQIELGIYAGRLYFEWDEYENMCALMGIQDGAVEDDEISMGEMKDDPVNDESINMDKLEPHKQLQAECKLAQNPLTFLQEWLAVRRRGQDFAHSPMGFVSQGKRLQGDHIFFKQAEHAVGSNDLAPLPLATASTEKDDRDDGYYGVDDMGANEAGDSDSSDDDIEYDEFEYADSASSSN